MKAEAIAKALGGRKVGRNWMARCPAHDDRCPSLSVRDTADGRVLLHCFSGCTQAQLIAALRSLGLWESRPCSGLVRERRRGSASSQTDHDNKGTIVALGIWKSTTTGSGTAVET